VTTTAEVLSSLRFGHVVAERDSELKKVFVQTGDFKALQSGDYDLITGVKGAGKSALLIMLLDHGAAADNVIIAPAQNVSGQSVYGLDLPSDRVLLTSDEYFQGRWMLHAYLVAATHLVNLHKSDRRLDGLRAVLKSQGLDVDIAKPRELWRLASLRSLTGTAFTTHGATSDLPLSQDPVEPEVIRDLLFTALDLLDVEIWVAYDRLDDVLAFDPDRERAMLRGLLAAMVSLASSSPRFHVKAFMRHDLFDRVTEEKSVRNVDQLSRLRLRWNTQAVMRLIAARAVRSPFALEAFGVRAQQDAADLSKSDVEKIWLALLWIRFRDVPEDHPERHFVGFLRRVADGSGEFNPRVLLSFFALMARIQASIDEENPHELPSSSPLIGDSAAQRAIVDLSDARLNQYIFAEFQHLKEYTLALVEKANAFSSKAELLGALGLENNRRSSEIVREMVGCGLLATGEGAFPYSVAKLYKPALRSRQPRQSPPGSAQKPSADAVESHPMPAVTPSDVARLTARFRH
jgi:hypothetical protein